MREKFNHAGLWDQAKKGVLKQIPIRVGHPSPPKADEPNCTHSQIISYRDRDGKEIARIHQYVRPDGSIGASGLPDPNRLLLGGTLYYLPKKRR